MAKALADLGALIRELPSAVAGQPPAATKVKVAPAAAAAPKGASAKAAPAAPAAEAPFDPELERKYGLVRSVGEECVAEPELRNLLQKKPNFVLYDGFEPSGRMHIAQGIYKAMNVNKCTAAGGTFVFWVADWFALMNDKMGGDLERIKTVGQYLIQVWTAAGMDMTRVKFLWSSEEICKHALPYWTQALDIGRKFSVARIMKCCQIMGRKEGTLTAAQILYPIMQCTDIFFLKADVCQLGVDQRKVNMLAREYCDAAGIKLKPIILSHHMLYGLKEGQQKMSKSDADSAIFMEDSAHDVKRKLDQAHCPTQEAEEGEGKVPEEESMQLVTDRLKNPCLDYVQHVLFSVPTASFSAGGTTYSSFAAVREAFLQGSLSEADLKAGLVLAVNGLLEPVRSHFNTDAEAKRILGLITGWMAEPKGARRTPLRRLDAAAGPGAHVVFAPLPSLRPTLASALDTLRCLNAAPAGAPKVLWLRDWSGFCLNCVTGGKAFADDLKGVHAACSLFVGALRALAPALMAGVRVQLQSAAILSNPSDYWISVINVGRAFQLSRVRAVDESNPEAGQVLAAVMHVADVLAVGAWPSGGAATSVGHPPEQAALHALAIEYLSTAEAVADAKLQPPTLVPVAHVSLSLKALDAPADVAVGDGELLLLEPQPDVVKKIKKAFCEPGNVAHCPPIALAVEVALAYGEGAAPRQLVVPSKGAEPQSFGSGAQLQAAFAAGTLHPGDLKPAVRDAVEAVLQRVRAHVLADKELAAAEKEMQKVHKRMTSKK